MAVESDVVALKRKMQMPKVISGATRAVAAGGASLLRVCHCVRQSARLPFPVPRNGAFEAYHFSFSQDDEAMTRFKSLLQT